MSGGASFNTGGAFLISSESSGFFGTSFLAKAGGGGFGWPRGKPGDAGFGVTISGSNLALLDSTDGFRDLLTPARLAGQVDARLDETTAIRLRDVVSQIVTDGLGRTRWVDATTTGARPGELLATRSAGFDRSSVDPFGRN